MMTCDTCAVDHVVRDPGGCHLYMHTESDKKTGGGKA